ncbi:hypothetical protein [Methylobacterium soli]|nr:hypothetical protein [Methylobacterium soli]
MSFSYIRRLREFAARCDQRIRQDISCVTGTLLHGWHSSKKDR